MNNSTYTWDTKIAHDWDSCIPPSRPSPSEISEIHDAIRTVKPGSSALILGSTAEFRDLVFLRGLNAVCVDYDGSNYGHFTHKMRHPTTAPGMTSNSAIPTTRLVVKDWRKMDFSTFTESLAELGADSFDLVLGDLAVNMVKLGEQQSVLLNSLNLLRPGGLLIQRVWVRHENKYSPDSTSVREIIAEHLNSPERSSDPWFYSLALPLISFFHDPALGGTEFQNILNVLKNLHSEEAIPYECLDGFMRPWEHYFMPNYLPLLDDFMSFVSSIDAKIHLRHGKDPYSDMAPILIIKK